MFLPHFYSFFRVVQLAAVLTSDHLLDLRGSPSRAFWIQENRVLFISILLSVYIASPMLPMKNGVPCRLLYHPVRIILYGLMVFTGT